MAHAKRDDLIKELEDILAPFKKFDFVSSHFSVKEHINTVVASFLYNKKCAKKIHDYRLDVQSTEFMKPALGYVLNLVVRFDHYSNADIFVMRIVNDEPEFDPIAAYKRAMSIV